MEIGEATVDDLVKSATAIVNRLSEFRQKENVDAKIASAISKADDADSRFKANIIISAVGLMDQLKMMSDYISQPVKKEGILQRRIGGNVTLDDEPVADGAVVEFLKGGEWKMGKIVKSPQTSNYSIVDMYNFKPLDEIIDQVKARIRQ